MLLYSLVSLNYLLSKIPELAKENNIEFDNKTMTPNLIYKTFISPHTTFTFVRWYDYKYKVSSSRPGYNHNLLLSPSHI